MDKRFSLPISIRILSFVVLPIMAALVGGFWILTVALTSNVKAGARATIAEVQQADRKIWAESDTQQQAAVLTITENPALKAGLMLYRETGRSAESLATIADQLNEIHSGLTYELLMILDADRMPLAASLRNAIGSVAGLDLGHEPVRMGGVLEANGKVYRAIAVPVNLGSENFGYFITGREFNVHVPYGFSVLLRGNQVVTGLRDGRQRAHTELAGQIANCGRARSDCELRFAGETWIASRLQLDGLDADYGLWILQSVDTTLARFTAGMNRAFVLVSAGILAIATLLALFTSHGVAAPLTQLIRRLQESERTGVLRGDLELTSSTSEVNELARAFNSAAKALADSQRRLDEAYLQFTRTMAQALDARDHYTAGHSSRVSAYAVRIAAALELPEREQTILKIGAMLHDIGKIGIPDQVLQKPGKLTGEEYALIRQHPLMGKRILEGVAKFHDYLSIVELHHENHDGSGYPWGLQGDRIPLGARIVHVVDAFDAMTSTRTYRAAMPASKALDILQRNAGTQFDPFIVQAFIEMVKADPGLLPPDPASLANLNHAVRKSEDVVEVEASVRPA